MSPIQTGGSAAVFKVLANDTRLRLLHALVRADELCVTDLAASVGMKAQAAERGYSFAEAARQLGVRDHRIRTRKKSLDAEVGGAASGAGHPAALRGGWRRWRCVPADFRRRHTRESHPAGYR